MKQVNLSKIAFYTTSACIVVGLAFGFGLYSGVKRTEAFDFVKHAARSVEIVFDEWPTVFGSRPENFLQPAVHEGAGVTANNVAYDIDEFILLSGFFGDTNELRLIRRNGDLIASWPVRFSELFPDRSHMPSPPATDWNIDTHGALALPDGSVVFNFEYGGLVKLDRCGDPLWMLPRATHHSVERAEGGGFWVPGRRFLEGRDSPFPPFPLVEGDSLPLMEDTLLRVSDDGEVLEEISVPQIFYDNGLEALLTATGHLFTYDMEWDREIVHLNKIEELTADVAESFPDFEAGDLALSIREMNLIMVMDPDTHAVKWWKIGPWIRQHDPEFNSDGNIVIFNNNTYPIKRRFKSTRSNIATIDPSNDQYDIIYGQKDGQKLLSVMRGKVDLTSAGGLLITEFQAGRVVETDAAGNIIWEYVNRFDADEVAEISEARAYPKDYFNVDDWSCIGPEE